MGTLYLYGIFHANLSFSSIPPDQYSNIIDTCYWPVVELVRKGYKLGLEFNTFTLKQIKDVDEYLLNEIQLLWMENKCDVIGSSYIQNISALIPYEINKANYNAGKKDYLSLLGQHPYIGFVNEQTYSKSIPNIFTETGYKALVMDWDNASEFHDFPPDLRYCPALATGIDNVALPIIWNSSLNSYKFQRCIYKRLSIDDYIEGVINHRHTHKDRALPLYGTDWEIFNYRPGTQQEATGEIERIEQLLKKLTDQPNIKLVTPSEILSRFKPYQKVTIESPQCPLPCKNRDDYNVLRWSVSGRDNLYLNTECFKIYKKYKIFSSLSGIEYQKDNRTILRNLNKIWGSDLRTKTTDEKHYSNKLILGQLSHTLDKKISKIYTNFNPNNDFILINPMQHDWQYEPYILNLNFKPGNKKGALHFEINGQEVTAQIEEFELYKDHSYRRIKAVILPYIKAGYAVEGKIIDSDNPADLPTHYTLRPYIGDKLTIKTSQVQIHLAASTGADIRDLSFPDIYKDPLIGYLPPVYYDHIGHSNDYYTGGLSIGDRFGRIYNDTTPTILNIPDNQDIYPIRIPIKCEINMGIGTCWKEYYIYRNTPRIDLNYRLYFNDLQPAFLRVGITTIHPESFKQNSLHFTTVNGYIKPETFYPAGRTILHTTPVGAFSSARTSLGATEGWVDISDNEKGITIATDKSMLFSVPMIEYEQIKQSYLFRLYHSIAESDETGKGHFRGHSTMNFSLFGHGKNLAPTRNKINHIMQNLICIQKQNSSTTQSISHKLQTSTIQTNHLMGI